MNFIFLKFGRQGPLCKTFFMYILKPIHKGISKDRLKKSFTKRLYFQALICSKVQHFGYGILCQTFCFLSPSCTSKKFSYLIHGLSDINGRLVRMQEICRFIGAFQYVIHNKFYYVLYFLCTLVSVRWWNFKDGGS